MRKFDAPPNQSQVNGSAPDPHHNGHAPGFDPATWIPDAGAELTLNAWAIYDPEAAQEIGRQNITFNDPICRAIFNAHRAIFATPEPLTPEAIADLLLQQADATPLESERAVLCNAAAAVVKIGPPRGDARREIKRLLNEIGESTGAANPRWTLTGLKEVLTRPSLKYLLRDMLLEIGISCITADYGAYKSFNVLDMGLCIATGKDWHGRAVKSGPVVYVLAEGAYTTKERLQAWLIRYPMEVPQNFYIIESGVQIANPIERNALIESLREVAPALIIFDTLAKCNVGKDENASAEMGLFTHGMETISHELSTHVMVVHHNNKAGGARGSNSLPSNVDTHIVLEKAPGRTVTFKCDKQKGAPFEAFALMGRVVELPEKDEYGMPRTSLVFEPTDAPAIGKKAEDTQARMVEILSAFGNEGAKAKAWQEACANKGVVKERAFYNHRDDLQTAGTVAVEAGVYRVTALTALTANAVQMQPNAPCEDLLHCTAPPLRGAVHAVNECTEQKTVSPSKRKRKRAGAVDEPYQGTEVTIE
jgi:hypothetical protein